MNPKVKAVAGSLESSDVMIMVAPHESRCVEVSSVVKKQWGRRIEAVIVEELSKAGVDAVLVNVHDKGARECTIRARLKTALTRAGAL